MADYLRDPAEIYRRSLATIAVEADLGRLPEDLRGVAMRLIHACGMIDLVTELVWSDDVATAARKALARGATVLCDSNMVCAGIIRRRLPAENPIVCMIDSPETTMLATARRTTRSAAAVDLWRSHLGGAIVAIGNAPTALFRLLEMIDEGAEKPAAVVAFPVGFIGAAESKTALVTNSRGVPFLTLLGRRGGSAMAAAAVNSFAVEEDLL
ncbi:MAG: precorrin-8X methylmutase [Alphaproteobacteria bacterium]|nr:precorrin-8X methylmutase [Alphaproteobacteria bacterium]